MHIPIKELEGRDHYVVPTVMITQGVHNGSGGPVYYSADELRKSAHLWDGKPVVVYHPMMYHTPTLAGKPDVFNRQKVGTVFNTTFDGHRLKAEAWIDKERIEKVDPRIAATIRGRQMMEVSTGLLFPKDPSPGIFNGKQFDFAARNMQPDHLAILPDSIGACSIADGAGLVRNSTGYSHYEMPGLLVPTLAY